MPTLKVTHMDFCVAWASAAVAGKTIEQVVKDTGLTRQSATVRASTLRKRGVQLPPLRKLEAGLSDLDIAQYNNRTNNIMGKEKRL